ncbi:MAG: ABC transporter ATP-binding protein [Promethearchaeota archaeon]
MPDIELKGVMKTFDEGRVVAVDGVSLKITDGEFVFLLGPSGCGKTTTLRIISGLETPDSGEVLIDGRDVRELPPWERGMGFVFQHFEIFPHMTVWENAVYGLEVRGYSDEYTIQKGEEALKMVGLLDYADEYPDKFGNPGLQRLGIARAIATGARVLIMDEPLGSLDPKVRLTFRHELRRLVKSLGLTAIQVTHDQDEALSIGDRIFVMRKGRILQEGSPEVVYNFPRTIFVANFIGEMNFLQGFVFPGGQGDNYLIQLRMHGPRVRAAKARAISAEYQTDQLVVCSVRFENVHVFPPGFDFDHPENANIKDELNIFPVTLESQRFIGKATRFIAKLENGDLIEAVHPGAFKTELAPREKFHVGIHPNDIITFKHPKNLEHELELQ